MIIYTLIAGNYKRTMHLFKHLVDLDMFADGLSPIAAFNDRVFYTSYRLKDVWAHGTVGMWKVTL